MFLILGRSPVILSRAFGQAADRVHLFARPSFDVCKVLGSVLVFFVTKWAGRYPANLKTRSILRSCVVLHWKNYRWITKRLCSAVGDVRFDFGFGQHRAVSLTGFHYTDW